MKNLIVLLFSVSLVAQIGKPTAQWMTPVRPAAHNGSYTILTTDLGATLTTNITAAWALPQCGSSGFLAYSSITVAAGIGATLTVTTTGNFYGGAPTGTTLTVAASTADTLGCDLSGNWFVNAGGGVGVTSVTATAPVTSSGSTTPVIAINNATSSTFGVVKPDNTTITVSGGVITATGGGGSYTAGTGIVFVGSVIDVDSSVVPVLSLQNTFTGALNDFSGSQIRMQTGSGAPSSGQCTIGTVGELYVNSSAAAVNSSVYSCDNTASATYTWELLGGSSGSSLSVSGPYLTNGTNYWIQGTGFTATLFSNTGFSFASGTGTGWTQSTLNHMGVLTTSGTNIGAYEVAVSGVTTLTVSVKTNITGYTGSSSESLLFIGGRDSSNSEVCGITIPPSNAGYAPSFYSEALNDTSYNYVSNFQAGPVALLGDTLFLRMIVTAGTGYSCYWSNDGSSFIPYVIRTDSVAVPTHFAIGGQNYGVGNSTIDILSWGVQ